MLVEHAIFTSAQTRCGQGYHLVAASPGITPVEAQELARWGPSHDALAEAGHEAVSINFHSLTTGRFCISKTTHAGREYSGRAGLRVYTQFLVIGRQDLASFANNPFAVLRAASLHGQMEVSEQVPPGLQPIRLAGKTAPVDCGLLNELTAAPGIDWLCAFIDAALSAEQVVLIANRQRRQLVAGLFNCLPVECRTGFSFMTGLKPSTSRRFRISCYPDESAETRRLGRDSRVAVIRLTDSIPAKLTSHWARYVKHALTTGNRYRLASQLAVCRSKLSLASLDALGQSLLAALESPEASSEFSEPVAAFPRLAQGTDVSPSMTPAVSRPRIQRDWAGRGVCNSLIGDYQRNSTMMIRPALDTPPGERAYDPCTLEALELLDDTVFAAIAGSTSALERLRQLWPATLAKLGADELAESREHYIRRALASWRNFNEAADLADRARALQAIEVVCTLVGQ
jgi:hypothetical protein